MPLELPEIAWHDNAARLLCARSCASQNSATNVCKAHFDEPPDASARFQLGDVSRSALSGLRFRDYGHELTAIGVIMAPSISTERTSQ